MNIRQYILRGLGILFIILNIHSMEGKIKLPKTVIRGWQLPHPLALADSVGTTDSTYINFPMRNVQYDHSILNHYNGNLVSPLQSAIFFDRTKKTDCIFATAYDIYTTTPQDVRFYNTTTPYSIISYKRGFTTYHEDHDLGFQFTGNLNKRTNLGTTINYIDAGGHYKNQAGKTVNGSFFGSYNGDNYSLQASFTYNTLSNFENGGLSDPADLQNKDLKTEDMPVSLEAMSGFRYLAGYLNHYYSITKMTTDSVIVPVITFRHVFEGNDATRRYLEHEAQQGIYEDCYLNTANTRDTMGTTTIRNTLAVTFEEAFNRKLRFGITAYAYNEFQRHTGNRLPTYEVQDPEIPNSSLWDAKSITPTDTKRETIHWSNNTFVGGSIHKYTGKWIHYQAGGDVCLVGRKLGEFNINGNVNVGFRLGKDSMTIAANVKVRNETPDYFLQHFVSNHYVWDNNFKKIYHFHVGGQVAYPTMWFKPAIKFDYESITRHIYFQDLNGPSQHDGTINVLAGMVQADLTTPWINLDNQVAIQYSSSNLIALPLVALYSNLYYHGTWFKALDTQIGVDLTYNTEYYAPYLNAALGQFAAQENIKVGNYPRISVYANFYVRLLHLRFFAQYQHLNASFMDRNYYSMPYYPTNPDVFRAGLAFHFYN